MVGARSTCSVKALTRPPRVTDASGARIFDDQRYVVGRFVPAAFAEQPVVAHLLAVIGGEYDQRAVPSANGFQMGKEPPELIVDLAHEAVIDGLEPAQFLVVAGGEKEFSGELIGEPRMDLAFLIRARQALRRGNVLRIVERIIGLGGEPRRMRPQKRQVQRPGMPRARGVGYGRVDGEGRVVMLLGDNERLWNRRPMFIVRPVRTHPQRHRQVFGEVIAMAQQMIRPRTRVLAPHGQRRDPR